MADAEDESATAVPPTLIVPSPISVTNISTIVALSLHGSLNMTTLFNVDQPTIATLHGFRYGWEGETAPYPDANIPTITNAQTQKMSGDVVTYGYYDNQNITDLLLRAGLHPSDVDNPTPLIDTTTLADGNTFGQLLRLGAVVAIDNGDKTYDYAINWLVERDVQYQLPASGDYHFNIAYQTRPIYRFLYGEDLQNIGLAQYCITPKLLYQALLQDTKDGHLNTLSFDITTGVDDRPSTTTILKLEALPASTFYLFCRANGDAGIITSGHAGSFYVKPDAHGIVHILRIGTGMNTD